MHLLEEAIFPIRALRLDVFKSLSKDGIPIHRIFCDFGVNTGLYNLSKKLENLISSQIQHEQHEMAFKEEALKLIKMIRSAFTPVICDHPAFENNSVIIKDYQELELLFAIATEPNKYSHLFLANKFDLTQ